MINLLWRTYFSGSMDKVTLDRCYVKLERWFLVTLFMSLIGIFGLCIYGYELESFLVKLVTSIMCIVLVFLGIIFLVLRVIDERQWEKEYLLVTGDAVYERGNGALIRFFVFLLFAIIFLTPVFSLWGTTGGERVHSKWMKERQSNLLLKERKGYGVIWK